MANILDELGAGDVNASATQPRHDVQEVAARLSKLPADKQAIFCAD